MRVTGLAKVVCYDLASLYQGSFWQLQFKQSFFRVNLQLLDLQLPRRNFEVFCRQKLQPGCELKWQHSIDDLGTLHMSPVDRAGPVSEISLHL